MFKWKPFCFIHDANPVKEPRCLPCCLDHGEEEARYGRLVAPQGFHNTICITSIRLPEAFTRRWWRGSEHHLRKFVGHKCNFVLNSLMLLFD